MKIGRISLSVLVLMFLMLNSAFAQNSGFLPSLQGIIAGGVVCTGINVTRDFQDDTLERFNYTVTVSPGATVNGIPVFAAEGLLIYPNAGNSHPGPDATSTPLFPEWTVTAYDTVNNGFAFVNKTYNSLILQGQSKLVGTAYYTTHPFPNTEVVAVAILDEDQNTYFCVTNAFPPVVPEPNTMALMGMGLAPLAGMIRRKRK